VIRHTHLGLLLCALSLPLAGCGENGSGDPGGSGGSGATGGSGSSGSSTAAGTGGGNSCSATFDATTTNNYTFSSTITLTPVLVKPDSELTFDWSAVSVDFMGHDLDPAVDIDTANLVLWALNEADLETKLNADDLKQSESVVPATAETNNTKTSVGLFEFQAVSGEPITEEQILPYMNAETYPPEQNTYTFIIATGSLLTGGRARMIQAVKLDPASSNTAVAVTNDSTKLDYEVDLLSLTPTMVPADQADLTVSWEDIMTNAMGHTFKPTQITEVRIAHYTETQAELEQQFLDLELIAQNTWRDAEVAGTTSSLSSLKDETGATFPGISADGTWILGLVCGTCRNPAPWYITILKPCL
jgi:hypothetical protein